MNTHSQPEADVFALLIGIDKYVAKDQGLPILYGAVNDATEFNKFLLDPQGLAVPSSHVKLLTNKHATRAAILSTFISHFLDNTEIPDHGSSAMILYFAGHGSRTTLENNVLSTDGMVEAICPVDERTSKGIVVDIGSYSAIDKDYIYGIPDYVLGQLLHILAEKKGKNITVILDSCHSGGMGRKADVEGSSRNATTPSLFIPPALDSHLWKQKPHAGHSYSVWAPTSTSHVLLAACSQEGAAYESPRSLSTHGYFSQSLLAALRGVDLNNTTYAELVDGLAKLPNKQTPVCNGNKHRLIFTNKSPAVGQRRVLIKESSGTQSFSVSIGAIQGVCVDTEFSIYTPDNHLICTVAPKSAESVESHRTVLTFDRTVAPINNTVALEHDGTIKIPQRSSAVVKNFNNAAMTLHVYIHPDFKYAEALFSCTDTSYKREHSQEKAHIALRTDGDEIVVDRLALTTHFLQETLKEAALMPPVASELVHEETRFDPEQNGKLVHLPSAFNGIAHFHYFLRVHNGNVLFPGFALEMHRLQGSHPQASPDLTKGDKGNLVMQSEIRVRSEVGADYGFTIRNTSDVDLFPYLFYFDPDTYTILCWFSPENPTAPPPLRSQGSLTVGMGTEDPFEFILEENQNTSSGFLKLFVSTEYLDLSQIKQDISPLDPDFRGSGRLKGRRVIRSSNEKSRWNAIAVCLTMYGS
ncbi:caspase domain-containing protein [Mycena epipterygia]|nr:caspase domain-containing protein [Mycena epipterygia]